MRRDKRVAPHFSAALLLAMSFLPANSRELNGVKRLNVLNYWNTRFPSWNDWNLAFSVQWLVIY